MQTTSKLKPEEPLRTNAWTKMPLFDDRNRLLNGRWKIPLLSLPIQPDELFPVLDTWVPVSNIALFEIANEIIQKT